MPPSGSRWTAESVFEEFLRPGGNLSGPALPSPEPGRRPWPLLDHAEVAAHVINYRRYLFLGQLLDQTEQLLTLRAHDFSVRGR